jgi:peptidoglycan/LPS O-acetylase OafA/YrhL
MHTQDRLPLIDILRGVAILMVIYHHLYGDNITVPGWHGFWIGDIPFFPFTILSNGFQGVALFFILSGFVLSLPYFSGRRHMQNWSDARQFYRRRFWRLYPLFAVAVLFGMLFIHREPTMALAVKNGFMMLSGLFVFSRELFMPPYNWVLWTLGLELWFSLLLPPLLLIARRIGVVRLAVCAVIFSILYRISTTMVQWHPPGGWEGGLLARLDDFAIGILLAYCFLQKGRLSSNTLVVGALSLIAGFILGDLVRLGAISVSYGPLRNLLVSTGFFLLILALLQRPFPAWRPLRALQTIGVACYSVYVWHGILMRAMHPQENTARLLTYLLCLGIISAVSYRVIERGGMRLGTSEKLT